MKRPAIRAEVIIAGMVLVFGLAFAVYTQHAWEDYWITFRSSHNLATGHGLVFTPGERLHTFTSPLGVLLPAGFCWLTGGQSDDLVLWLFRLSSITVLAAGLALSFQVLQSLQLLRSSCWLGAMLIGLDAKILDFSINGMETGWLIFFLALSLHGLLVPGPRQRVRIGIGWAGLMWCRPDSCVYIALLGAGSLVFLPGPAATRSRKEWAGLLLRAAAVCAVLYLPWFLWAWWYYGSPIPHTILAKAANLSPITLASLATGFLMFPCRLLTSFYSSIQWVFLPAYASMGGWDPLLYLAGYALGLVAAFAWLMPGIRPTARWFSLVFFLGNYFLTVVIGYSYPWYLPTVAVFGYLTICLLFDQALGHASTRERPARIRGWRPALSTVLETAAVALVMGQVALTVCVARQLHVQQALIENGLRRQIGLWLRAHARTPHDSVMLEPLGYIGYFSNLKMLDYPGLASNEMVEARKRLGPEHEGRVLVELRPDWVVLRPHEIDSGQFIDGTELSDSYERVESFNVTDQLNAIRWLPGRNYIQFDQIFWIYHRKPNRNSAPES